MRTIWGKQPCFKNAIPLQRGCCKIRKSETLSIYDHKIGKFKAQIEKREKAKKVVPRAIFSPGSYLNLNNNCPATFVPSGPRLHGMTHDSVLLSWFRFKLGFFRWKISVFPWRRIKKKRDISRGVPQKKCLLNEIQNTYFRFLRDDIASFGVWLIF